MNIIEKQTKLIKDIINIILEYYIDIVNDDNWIEKSCMFNKDKLLENNIEYEIYLLNINAKYNTTDHLYYFYKYHTCKNKNVCRMFNESLNISYINNNVKMMKILLKYFIFDKKYLFELFNHMLKNNEIEIIKECFIKNEQKISYESIKSYLYRNHVNPFHVEFVSYDIDKELDFFKNNIVIYLIKESKVHILNKVLKIFKFRNLNSYGFLACALNKYTIAKMIIKAGANNIEDLFNQSVSYKSVDIIKYILSNYDIEKNKIITKIFHHFIKFFVIEEGDFHFMKLIVDKLLEIINVKDIVNFIIEKRIETKNIRTINYFLKNKLLSHREYLEMIRDNKTCCGELINCAIKNI